jgi:glycogen synthase
MTKELIIIVTVFPFPHGGGMMSHIELLKRGLEERDFNCIVVSGNSFHPFIRLLFIKIPTKIISVVSHDAAVILLNEITSFLLAVIVFTKLLKNKNAVINPQSPYCMPWILKVARLLSIRVVLTVHGYATYEPISQGYIKERSKAAAYYDYIERISYDKSNFIVTVDKRIRDHVLSYGVPSSKVKSIKNFLDTDEFFPNINVVESNKIKKKYLGIEEDNTFICLCPRRWVPKNGVEYAIRSWKIVLEKAPNRKLLLVLVGFGQEENKLRKLAMDLGINEAVMFICGVDHSFMPYYFGVSDVVLIPSIHIANVEEATSIAALESMAAGKPTIVTNIGGLRELVENEYSGLIVPERNAEALADAIIKMLLNPEIKDSLGKNARNYVILNHGYQKATQEFISIYTPQK